MDARLCLVLTPALCRHGVDETVRAALDGGVDLVQLRDKDADDATFLATAREIGAICRERGVSLILNDRVHLVAAAGAEGAHVGEEDLPPARARALLPPPLLLGLSTHDRAEVAAAAAEGADYLGLGPMFPTESKVLRRTPGGPALVRAARGATALPVFCIGGIHAGNLPSLVEAGARRAAVSSAICAAADPAAAAASLRAILDAAPE